MTATALIADEDRVFRDLVRRTIEGCVRVVGEAVTDEAAISLSRQLEPDLVLMDLDLPVSGGLETIRRIKDERPMTRVILMTGHGEEAYLEATGRSGADAFLPKQRARTQAAALMRRMIRA